MCRAISALAGFIFVPIYVKLIGAESYGLVAFYGTMVSALMVLDLGLSTAISRQVTILRVQQNREADIQDLVFSVEVIYWLTALIIAISIILLAHPIAVHWVKAKDLPVDIIEKAIIQMGIVFAFQFPSSIYDGVMIGLERQVTNSVILASFAVLRAIGAIAALQLISAQITVYFFWQAIITACFTLLSRQLIKKYIATPHRASFSKSQIRFIWKFAAGMTGISLITFFSSQLDKIVVSKLVLLQFVGYYNLAFMLASSMTQLVSPLQTVIFPRFSALIAQGKTKELTQIYHRSCRWVAIAVFPLGFTLIFFAHEILFLWTRNEVLSVNTAPILRVFAAGTLSNCMMWIPYFFMLAKGNTKYTIYQNGIASIILVPLLFWWTSKYGALGASFVWLSINLGAVLISLPIIHHLYLKGELLQWYKKDIALPLFVSAALVCVAKYVWVQINVGLQLWPFVTMFIIIALLYVAIIPELRATYQKLILRTS